MKRCATRPGVSGLAAPQIGLPLQLAVIEDREEYMKDLSGRSISSSGNAKPVHLSRVIVNPGSYPRSPKPEVEFFEGCLESCQVSWPWYPGRAACGWNAWITTGSRPQVIQASGWYARILQHEIDHLRGTLYIDRMRSTTFPSLAVQTLIVIGRACRIPEIKRLLLRLPQSDLQPLTRRRSAC